MRLAVTILFALLASIPAGGIVAVLLADWVKADESFILVFFAIMPAALLTSAVFMFSAAKGATAQAARILLSIVVVTLSALALWDYVTVPYPGSNMRGVRLIVSMGITLATVIVVQWLIFLGRERRRMS